jgi:hypothetical protein
MKTLLLIALLAATQESDLVKAANAAKASRSGTKPAKVITNADVKKAKAKLKTTTNGAPASAGVVSPAKAGTASPAKAGAPVTSDQLYKARHAATDHVVASEKRVAELEKSLDDIEQSFYSENDPNYRDDVIQKRFAQTKRQLEDARKELADARDAAAALDK